VISGEASIVGKAELALATLGPRIEISRGCGIAYGDIERPRMPIAVGSERCSRERHAYRRDGGTYQ
jgi:hypothetical protein